MKKRTMKAKKKSYGYGTNSNYKIETPNEALQAHKQDVAKAIYAGESNPLANVLQMLGQTGMQVGSSMGGFGALEGVSGKAGGLMDGALMAASNFAYGGQTGLTEVNVEGDEVAETPNGQLLDINGPDHSPQMDGTGGVDAIFPDGTTIYSKRIKVDGKTLAERKKEREKRAGKAEKKSIGDYLSKSTAEKTLANVDKQEASDLMIQDQVGAMMAQEENVAGWGDNKVGGRNAWGKFWDKRKWQRPDTDFSQPESYDHLQDNYAGDKGSIPMLSEMTGKDVPRVNPPAPFSTLPGVGVPSSSPAPNPAVDVKNEQPSAHLTGADILGMAGTQLSTILPYLNTLQNEANTDPNVNSFENYGVDGLNKLDQAKTMLGAQEAKALRDAELTARTNATKARGSSRGVAQMQAQNLGYHQQAQQSKAGIRDMFAKQMMAILSQEAGFENMQDKVVMGGEAQRDLADRQDQDAFSTAKGQNLADIGRGVQQTGKDLNVSNQNKLSLNLLNELFQAGYIDQDGNIIQKTV